MTSIRRFLRSVAAVAAAAVTALAVSAAPAFATQVPPPGMGDPGTPVVSAPVQTVTVGGMPGWQILLIAVGSALLASALTLLAIRAARRATAEQPTHP